MEVSFVFLVGFRRVLGRLRLRPAVGGSGGFFVGHLRHRPLSSGRRIPRQRLRVTEERFMVFTKNGKEHLDQAILCPGRVDVHIHFQILC